MSEASKEQQTTNKDETAETNSNREEEVGAPDNSEHHQHHDEHSSTNMNSPHIAISQALEKVSGSCVEYYGIGVNFCGYCKQDEINSEGRRSYDMKAFRLTATDYQLLLDRGWRRSGNYCYHPLNKSTCCPNYPISCKTLEFNLSRSQRRCIENLNSFLINGETTSGNQLKINYDLGGHSNQSDLDSSTTTNEQSMGVKTFEELKLSPKARDRRFVRSCERKVRLYGISIGEAIRRVKERCNKGRVCHEKRPSLEDYLFPRTTSLTECQLSSFKPKHRLEIHMHHVESEVSKSMREDEQKLIQKYQIDIHKESSSDWTMMRYCEFLVNSPLVVEPIPNRCFTTHACAHSRDTLSIDVCTNNASDYLLVKPPELPTSYGTYHCAYILDDKLIAVGVLDLLPKCATTVYFFYDPAYGHLNLGIYSVMVEISMVRQMSRHYIGPPGQDKLIYYYMGFYVHECKKMHYKTRFRPSYLLCSETCQYVPTEICLNKLKDKKYARFSEDNSDYSIYEHLPNYQDILDIPVLAPVTSSTSMADYFRWLEKNLGVEYVELIYNNFLLQYVRLVGRPLLANLSLRVNAVHRALLDRYRRSKESNSSDSKATPNCHHRKDEEE